MKKCTMVMLVVCCFCVEQLHAMKLCKSIKTAVYKNYTKKISRLDDCKKVVCYCQSQQLDHFYKLYSELNQTNFTRHFKESLNDMSDTCRRTLKDSIDQEFLRCAEYGSGPIDALALMYKWLNFFEILLWVERENSRDNGQLAELYDDSSCYENCEKECNQCSEHDID